MSDTFTVRYAIDKDNDLFWPPTTFKPVEATLAFENLPIGTLEGTLVRAGILARAGEDLFFAFDAKSSELATVGFNIFTGRRYTKSFERLMRPRGMDILHLSRLTIAPGFRGHRLGLALIQYVLYDVPHDVAVIKPYPLQHEDAGSRSESPALIQYAKIPIKRATRKLVEHYAKIGFRPVPRSPLMARGTPEEQKAVDFDAPGADAVAAMQLASDTLAMNFIAERQERSSSGRDDSVLLDLAVAANREGNRKARNSALSIIMRHST